MGDWLGEVRYAARILARTPGFTIVAVLSLALGIGANAAVLSVMRAALLDPLPVRNPDELVVAYWRADALRGVRQINSSGVRDPVSGQSFNSNFPYSFYRALRETASGSADVFAFTFLRQANVSIAGQPVVAGGMLVSDNFFESMGVPMAFGRPLGREDERVDVEPAVVLGHAFWTRTFGADRSVLGRVVRVNGQPFTIVGVTAPGYFGVSQGGFFPPADITLSLGAHSLVMKPIIGSARSGQSGESAPATLYAIDDIFWLRVMARVPSAHPVAPVQQAMSATFANALKASELPALNRTEAPTLRLFPAPRGLDSLRRNMERPLYLLSGVVGLVFLIACVNLASIVLARSVARQQEMWVRLALGAGRLRIARHVLTESLLLALAGGATGLMLALWGARMLLALLGGSAALGVTVSLGPRLLLTTAAVSLAAGLLFGLLPALRLVRDTSRFVRPTGVGVGSPRLTVGRVLIALQVAVSLPVLVGAALFLRTLQHLGSVELGFNPRGVIVFKVDPTLNGYSRDRVALFYRRLLDRLATVPGVWSATLIENALISGWVSNGPISVDGREPKSVLFNHVSEGFFTTMGMALKAGRAIGVQDHEGSPRVAVVNEAAAREHFGVDNPVGLRFTRGKAGDSETFEVVGLVSDAKYDSLKKAAAPVVFLPHAQSPWTGAMHVAARVAADPRMEARLRAAVAEVDGDVPTSGMKTQAEQIDETIAGERVFTILLTFFGAFALLLACIGLHGVTAYAVARRRSEIGVRMALGAQRANVLWLILRQVVVLAAAGLLVGIPASVAAGRAVASFLYEVQPGDPVSIAAGALLLFTVAVASGYFPARRASRLDPLAALRSE